MNRIVRLGKAIGTQRAGCFVLFFLLAGLARAQSGVAGSLDPCFNSTPSGARTVPGTWVQQPQALPPLGQIDDFFSTSVVVLPDHRIVQVGTALHETQSDNFAIAVVHDGCELDATPVTQYFEVPFEPLYALGQGQASYDWASAAAVDKQGYVIVVGQSSLAQANDFDPGGNLSFAIARIDPGDKNNLPTVDTDFGFNGRVLVSFGPGSSAQAEAVAIDSEGRIVVVGSSDLGFAVARLLPDGTLDPSFGNTGEVEFSFDSVTDNLGFTFGVSGGGSAAFANGIAIDENGRIVVFGNAYDTLAFQTEELNHTPLLGSQHFAIARLNDDGSLDTTFGQGGKQLTSLTQTSGAISADTGTGVTIDPLTGIIVAGGYTNATAPCGTDQYGNIAGCPNAFNGFGRTFAIASYSSFDGSLLSKAVSSVPGEAFGIAIDTNHHLVMGGETCCLTNGNGGGYASLLAARFIDAQGALDFTFGNLGIATENMGQVNNKLLSFDDTYASNGGGTVLALDSLDRIILGGSTQYLGGIGGVQQYQFFLERFLSQNEDLSTSAGLDQNTITVGQADQPPPLDLTMFVESKGPDEGPATLELLAPAGIGTFAGEVNAGIYKGDCVGGPFLVTQETICTFTGISAIPATVDMQIVVPDTVPLGAATIQYKVIGNDPNIADNSGSFTIYVKSAQSINFSPIPNHSWSDPDFQITALATSGLPVTYEASGPCTVTGEGTAVVTMTAAGYCTITASQAGNDEYNAAPDVMQKFPIMPLDVTSDFTVTRKGFVPNLMTHTYTQTVALTNNSGEAITGPVSLVLDGGAATLLNATGTTSALAPPVSRYINDSTDISPGQTVVFTLQLSIPSNIYTVRVLSGPGSR